MTLTSTLKPLSLALAGLLLATTFAQALDNGGMSTSDCRDRAKSDLNANVNSCNNVLSDLPDQLLQCISDAKDDYNRAIAKCDGASNLGSHHGLPVFDTRPASVLDENNDGNSSNHGPQLHFKSVGATFLR